MSTSPSTKIADITLTESVANDSVPRQMMSALSSVNPSESKSSSEEIGRTMSYMKEIFPLYVSTVALASVRTIANSVESDSDGESESSDDSDDEVVDSDDEVFNEGLKNQEKCYTATVVVEKSSESAKPEIFVGTNDLTVQKEIGIQIEKDDYNALVSAGVLLNSAISSCNGNTTALMKHLEESYRGNKFTLETVLRVIDDNIAACNRAGYVNKEKLFHHIRAFMERVDTVSTPVTQSVDGKISPKNGKINNDNISDDDSGDRSDLIGHKNGLLHAPKVMDVDISQKELNNSAKLIEAPSSFIDGLFIPSKKNQSGSAATVRNKKNKGVDVRLFT